MKGKSQIEKIGFKLRLICSCIDSTKCPCQKYLVSVAFLGHQLQCFDQPEACEHGQLYQHVL